MRTHWRFAAIGTFVLFTSSCDLIPGLFGKQEGPLTWDVKASEGLEFEKDGISIRIPPNALAADTRITAAGVDEDDVPESFRVASTIVDFGPDGTTFAVPVELGFTLDEGAFQPSPDAVPMLAFLKDGAWEVLPDSRLEGRTVFATTTHFTPFTVVWTSSGQSQGGCEELPFTPCGGELVGTWSFEAACAILPMGHVPLPGCMEAIAQYTIELTGTVTFNEDKTYSVSKTQDVRTSLTVPQSCLPTGKSCTDIPSLIEGYEYFGQIGTDCLVKKQKVESDTEEGTYTTNDNTFSTLETGDTTQSTFEYCRSGNSAVVRDVKKDGVEIRYRVTKM